MICISVLVEWYTGALMANMSRFVDTFDSYHFYKPEVLFFKHSNDVCM